MLIVDPLEAFRKRLNQRIRRVIEYRNEHPKASINEIAQATGYLPSSIKVWLGENEEDDRERRAERQKKLKSFIYGK